MTPNDAELIRLLEKGYRAEAKALYEVYDRGDMIEYQKWICRARQCQGKILELLTGQFFFYDAAKVLFPSLFEGFGAGTPPTDDKVDTELVQLLKKMYRCKAKMVYQSYSVEYVHKHWKWKARVDSIEGKVLAKLTGECSFNAAMKVLCPQLNVSQKIRSLPLPTRGFQMFSNPNTGEVGLPRRMVCRKKR